MAKVCIARIYHCGVTTEEYYFKHSYVHDSTLTTLCKTYGPF